MIKDWSWKAILGGLAICLIGHLVFGSILIQMWAVLLVSRGVPYSRIGTSFEGSTSSYIISFIALIVAWGLGGYATATWAPRRKVLHCLVVTVLLAAAVRAIHLIVPGSDNPLWFTICGRMALFLPILSGWWRVRTRGAESEVKPKGDSSSGSPPIASPF